MAIHLPTLRNFFSVMQLAAMRCGLSGEEAGYFREKLIEFDERIRTMPKTYEQDGKGDAAIVSLHYFLRGHDWYITERDMEEEQLQAFGLAALYGHEPELGYINITELIAHGAELDLHFAPCELGTIRAKRARRVA